MTVLFQPFINQHWYTSEPILGIMVKVLCDLYYAEPILGIMVKVFCNLHYAFHIRTNFFLLTDSSPQPQ